MRKLLKTLTETREISNGCMCCRGDSLDVQLDRWKLEQERAGDELIVLNCFLDTSVESELDGVVVVTTMVILYASLAEAGRYGVASSATPLETALYEDVRDRVDWSKLTGHVLLLTPTPVGALLKHADIQYAAASPEELDPETLGDHVYDAVIADRVLSRVEYPSRVVSRVRAALHRHGQFLVLEDGYAQPTALQTFSLRGLDAVLEGFMTVASGVIGNVLGVVHQLSGAGQWLPTRAQGYDSGDPEWPVHHWRLVRVRPT